MKKIMIGSAIGLVIATAVYFLPGGWMPRAGPNGSDLVPLNDGNAYAEVLANADPGEVSPYLGKRLKD